MQVTKSGRVFVMAAVAAASMAFASASKAATIAGWNFESDALAVNNTPAADTGTGTASSIGMNIYPTPNIGVTTDDVLLGVAADTGTNGLANTSQIWRVRAQAGPNGAANGWSSLAPIGTQGAIFSASTVGYNSINVGFDWYSTKRGEQNMQFEYTTNGVNFINLAVNVPAGEGATVLNNVADPNLVVGSYVQIASNSGGQQWIPGITATISDPNAANDPNFAIAVVNAATGVDCTDCTGGALNNNSGNWRFDNIAISGTPVPEPATVSLVGLAGLALLNRRRSRSK